MLIKFLLGQRSVGPFAATACNPNMHNRPKILQSQQLWSQLDTNYNFKNNWKKKKIQSYVSLNGGILGAFWEHLESVLSQRRGFNMQVLPGLAHRPRAWWVLKKRRPDDLTAWLLCSLAKETPLNSGVEQLAATTRRRLAMMHTHTRRSTTGQAAPLLDAQRGGGGWGGVTG